MGNIHAYTNELSYFILYNTSRFFLENTEIFYSYFPGILLKIEQNFSGKDLKSACH